MMKPIHWNLVASITILAAGVLAAVVCFGLLESQAEGGIGKRYSFQGAIAGALAAVAVTGGLFGQLQRSTDQLARLDLQSTKELEKLREDNENLRRKIVRGAPQPDGFALEVDERQKVVLSRPEGWEPMGGNLFAYSAPVSTLREKDSFPPSMTVSFTPITDKEPRQDEYFAQVRNRFHEGLGQYGGPYRSELISVGGGDLQALKLVARAYVQVVTRTSALTDLPVMQYTFVKQDAFKASVMKRVSGVLEDNFPASQGFNELRKTRDLAQRISILVEEQLENGHLDDSDLEDYVVRLIAVQPDEEHSVQDEASDKTNATMEAAVGAASVEIPSSSDETSQILPVAKMTVVCYHWRLSTIFFFEFEDDSRDYMKSSSIFNKILQTVRFLD